MPIYESVCADCETSSEWYAPRFDSSDPQCFVCGKPMKRLISSFSVVFTGPMTARYNDPKSENPHEEGHWAFRKRSSLSGNPEPVFLETWQDRKEFMKAEGLVGYEDVGPVDTSPDGRWSNARTGKPGTWI